MITMFRRLPPLGFFLLPLPLCAALLPEGPRPEPLNFPHFPSRQYAFVWRNWNLVPASRLASVLGTRVEKVRRLARDIGCAPEETPDYGRRIALTLIRRNWHLLPYPQLLELLGWSETELAENLRENDFLWIKLGRLKPRAKPIKYHTPTEQELASAHWFRTVVQEARRSAGPIVPEPRFAFLKDLTSPLRTAVRPPPQGPIGVRFIYSYFAEYGDPLLDPKLDPYPEAYLARLADCGVNGVWLHVVLYKLAPGSLFPQEKKRAERRLEALRRLAARAARHGIGVYLYLNEPRACDSAFFAKHPNLRGVQEGDLWSLCTSTREVKDFLYKGAAHIFRSVPGLAGFFTITASENLTNCWSHHRGSACPRCSKRDPAEVVAEVNTLLARGAWEGNPEAKVIVWDWGWPEKWVEGICRRLPARAYLMSVSEWSKPIVRGSVRSNVGEYSLSVVGPGPRALHNWKTAARYGHPTAAKVQINNTWELSTVPFLPVTFNVARHMHNLRAQNVSALMLSWSLGGYPSINLHIVREFCKAEVPSVQQALEEAAQNAYGARCARRIVEAWRLFSEAFSQFPFHIGVLYRGPQQLGPANLLYCEPTGYRSTMTGFPYDDLDLWRSIYPRGIFARQFELLAEKWKKAVEVFTAASALAPADKRDRAARDLRVAKAAGLHFESVANQARFIIARDRFLKTSSEELRRKSAEELRACTSRELQCAKELYKLAARDSRLGFEAANQYFYLPQDLLEKIVNCRYILDNWLPQALKQRTGK